MSSRIVFYRFASSDPAVLPAPPLAVDLVEFKPSPFRLKRHPGSALVFAFWYIATVGRYRIFYALHEGKIVHYSVVLPKFFKFPFMNPGDLEIGPCWTHGEYRGKGIYPFVLASILRTLRKQGRSFFIFSDENNTASQKGILKAGFTRCGTGAKKGKLGIYTMETL